MDNNMITGIVILIVAMVLLTILTVWSVRTINYIARKGCRTSRQTLKELDSER